MRMDSSLPPPSDATPAEPRRLLVVDDDRLVLATLVHGLVHAGFEVIDADNGDDAILLARQHRPTLALLDIRMDGLSGFDVAAYLRDQLHIPFMFLSAFSDEATQAKIRELGALAYLVKPLDVAQVVPEVERAYAQALGRARREPAVAPPPPPVPAAAPQNPAPQEAAPTDRLPVVPLAVGILMHRFSLSREVALQRLQRLAAQEGRPLEHSAAAMVAALEQLALPGQL